MNLQHGRRNGIAGVNGGGYCILLIFQILDPALLFCFWASVLLGFWALARLFSRDNNYLGAPARFLVWCFVFCLIPSTASHHLSLFIFHHCRYRRLHRLYYFFSYPSSSPRSSSSSQNGSVLANLFFACLDLYVYIFLLFLYSSFFILAGLGTWTGQGRQNLSGRSDLYKVGIQKRNGKRNCKLQSATGWCR